MSPTPYYRKSWTSPPEGQPDDPGPYIHPVPTGTDSGTLFLIVCVAISAGLMGFGFGFVTRGLF
jgi:hypothetical protein